MISFSKLKKTPNYIVIFIIRIYRWILSPSVGILRFLPFYPRNSCIFYPTCSDYSIKCFEKYNFLKALRKSINRICRCHPNNNPTIDWP